VAAAAARSRAEVGSDDTGAGGFDSAVVVGIEGVRNAAHADADAVGIYHAGTEVPGGSSAGAAGSWTAAGEGGCRNSDGDILLGNVPVAGAAAAADGDGERGDGLDRPPYREIDPPPCDLLFHSRSSACSPGSAEEAGGTPSRPSPLVDQASLPLLPTREGRAASALT